MSKKKILITIIPLLFIIGLLLNIPIKKGNAITENLNYVFDNDYIFNSNNLTYETFNIRNQTTIFQDNFTANYDFLNEGIGTSGTDIDYIDSVSIPAESSIEIISDLDGHNRVLDYYQASTVSYLTSEHELDVSQSSGTYEFWIYLTSDRFIFINMMDGASEGVYFGTTGDFKFGYNDGSWQEICDFVINTWYHIRVDFECGAGSYEGLAPDTFYIYINNIKYGAYDFRNSIDNMDGLNTGMYKCIAENEYHLYINAIGFNWYAYDINQNVAYPEITITEIQEVDKCEFDYNITTLEPNTLESLIIDNNWIENDDGTDVHVQTNGLGNGISIDYGMSQEQNDYGIYKEFSYNAENIFNISFDIDSIGLWSPQDDGWYLNIYTYDDTLLVSLLLLGNEAETELYYYDGSDYIYIHDIQDFLLSFSLNIYINDRVILSLNDDEVNYNWYFSELTDKIGINTIEIIGGHYDDIGDMANIEIDSIGLYINGSSYLPHDLSSIIIETDIENWNDNIHNLFGITGNGSFSFSVFYNSILADIILPYSTFNSETKAVNYVDGIIFDGSSPYTFVCISNTSFTVSAINVYAITLTEGVNVYLPTIEYNNVNNKENFFYVQNNKLYFYVDLNNYSYEGIKATFNIPEISTINGTISFINYYSGHLAPYFCINYTYSDISYYQFQNYPNTVKYILPQNQYSHQFIINVSDYIVSTDDNYTNHNSGFISGYIQNIKLGYIPDIGITITTIDLITVIIPIMFIFIPSLMFYYGFGKQAVIPAIILFSGIALISDLIQAWVFFVIAYSIFIQLITQRKRVI